MQSKEKTVFVGAYFPRDLVISIDQVARNEKRSRSNVMMYLLTQQLTASGQYIARSNNNNNNDENNVKVGGRAYDTTRSSAATTNTRTVTVSPPKERANR